MSYYSQMMIVLIAFFLVSVWVKSLIKILGALYIAPKFGYCCKQISVLWWTFLKKDEKWSCHLGKCALVFQHMLCIDIKKPVPKDINKKGRMYTVLSHGITLLISLVVLILCKKSVISFISFDCSNGLELFCAAFSVGMVFHSLADIVISLYTNMVIMKRLGGYVDSLINRLRNGESYESMNLKPVAELPYKNPTMLEKNLYYMLYLSYLIVVGKIEDMKAPINEMTAFFLQREYILQETLSYYCLIFYYSRYEINAQYADIFLRKVYSTIEKDSDANAKRVLAYYYYGVKHDIEKARQYVKEGIAVVNNFGLPGAERELEQRLLFELDDIITKKLLENQ